MLRFAVIVLGTFGFYVATALAEKGCEVTAIDIDEEKVRRVKDQVAKAVACDASDKANLAPLIENKIDVAIVSLGEEIKDAVLVIFYLKKMNISRIIVEAIKEEHGKVLNLLGATDIIYSQKSQAEQLVWKLISGEISGTVKILEKE